jgi:hypothetical protein
MEIIFFVFVKLATGFEITKRLKDWVKRAIR